MAERRLHAVLAEFEDPDRLIEAAREIRRQGFKRIDAFSPFPVEGIDAALGLTGHGVPRAMLIGGIAGAIGGFLMQVGTNLDFPLRIGGRPLVAVPAFMLICFELLVLGAVLSGIATMFAANRLPLLHHPLFNAERFGVGQPDRFFLAIMAGPDFDRNAAGRALAALRPSAIIDVPEEPEG